MNRDRPTEYKIGWTVEGLNTTLPIYRDVHNIAIPSKARKEKFAGGTEADIELIKNSIKSKVRHLKYINAWQSDYWYDIYQEDYNDHHPPSSALEQAWNDVGDAYVRLQHTWDTAEEIVAEEDENMQDSGDESEEIDPDDV